MSVFLAGHVDGGEEERRVEMRLCVFHAYHHRERVGRAVYVASQILVADRERFGRRDARSQHQRDGIENASEIGLEQILCVRRVVGASARIRRKLYPGVFVPVLRRQSLLVRDEAQPAEPPGLRGVRLQLSVSSVPLGEHRGVELLIAHGVDV